MFFTVRHLFFLLFLVLGQSQCGIGSDEVEEEYVLEEAAHQVKRFTAVSSLFFRPGTDYKVFFTVNPHPKNEPLPLKCVLMANSSESTTIQSESISLRPQESGQISIPLPREMPGNETVWRLFAWHFTEENGEEGYKYEAPHTLIYSSELANENGQSLKKADLASVFIQTDKPAYKPDDLVRIRVITMGSDDLPHLTAGVNMTITDSQGNLMKKWEQPLELPASASTPSNVSSNENVALFGEFQKKKNGLSSYEYQLSSEPILGNWTIQVEAGNIKEKMYFEVQRYILPKFQVKIETPSILHGFGEISTTAVIKASYTYGKGLQGTGNVTVTDDEGGPTRIQQIEVKDGEAIVRLKLSSSHSLYTINTVVVNVTDKSTGRWHIGEATVQIYPQETYSITWINEPLSYKPGLPLTVQLKITGRDGFPVKDVRKNALRITFSPSLNLPVQNISIQLSGIANFTFPTPLETLQPLQPANFTFQVLYKNATVTFPLPTAERATSSGILIEIVPPPQTTNFIQGNSYNFTIRSNKPIQPELFHCLLGDDAALEVHGAQTIVNNNSNETATEFPFALQIPRAAYTDLKIFVYFETKYNDSIQVISTSKAIYTHNYLKIRVSRPFSTSAPGLNNLTDNGIAGSGISSTVSALPDAPIETTTEEEYSYDDFAGDDPRNAKPEEPQPQTKPSSKLEVNPGDAIEIHFETYPDSTISIRGIDQSLLLLTEQDNDLNQEAVEKKRASLQSSQSELIIPPGNSTFLKAFRRFGISVLDSERYDAFVQLSATSFESGSLEEAEMAPSQDAAVDDSSIPQFDARLRTEFPETWLWEEIESSSNSSTTVLSKTLPDTLTSWIISGFSLNPKTGLGVASPATITGFMPFFVTLNLPYSVVKLETFDLQVIVHNHLDRDVKVFVTLFNRHDNSDSGFDFVDTKDNQRGNKTRSIRVKQNHAALTHFVITPMEMGEIPIEVKIVTEDGLAGDSIRRYLKVKPDGVRETKSQLYMLDAKSGVGHGNLSREATFDVEFPGKVVKGASTVQLTIVGDPMGTMTSNLGHLIRVPGGCGEQNMIRFVPNVLALNYLTATNSDASDVIQTARTNLEKGYQHQLQYRKSDGSFAVWEHQPGTTWLTSYVLRWFVEAQKYITIDNNVIKRATEFLLSRQRLDGSFLSLVAGPKYHPELCLYNCNGVALTTYITLALIKVNETSRSNSDLNLRVAIEKAMNYISKQTVYQLDDNYITNLVAATLMAGNHPEKTRFFEKMEKGAKATMTFKYWDMKNKTEVASGPLAIEMTSYALLAHLWKNPMSTLDVSTFNINKWLLSQRNPQGGFISTQDTMMGLTALSEFALRTRTRFVDEDELQLNIRASSSANANATELEVSVRRWNRMVLHEFELPVSAKKVNVKARGSGPALIQMTQSWYIPIKNQFPRSVLDHFNITAKMTIPDPEEPTETELTFCINSYHTSGARDSIASIQLPTGYAFYGEDYEADSDFMQKKPENVQRFELSEGNGKMDVYYTEIMAHPPTCLSLAATQQTEVANAKNPPILVYEYLNPARSAQVAYEPAHNITVCQICRSTRACGKEECK